MFWSGFKKFLWKRPIFSQPSFFQQKQWYTKKQPMMN